MLILFASLLFLLLREYHVNYLFVILRLGLLDNAWWKRPHLNEAKADDFLKDLPGNCESLIFGYRHHLLLVLSADLSGLQNLKPEFWSLYEGASLKLTKRLRKLFESETLILKKVMSNQIQIEELFIIELLFGFTCIFKLLVFGLFIKQLAKHLLILICLNLALNIRDKMIVAIQEETF